MVSLQPPSTRSTCCKVFTIAVSMDDPFSNSNTTSEKLALESDWMVFRFSKVARLCSSGFVTSSWTSSGVAPG